ncbi:MAG: thioredoxin [Pseudomonadota bacterium]
MLNFGGGASAPPTNTDLIKDSSEATFMEDVVEASAEVPVIVDFWAPWCGPCKTLGPAIETAVTKAGGKVKLVKIDIDQNQMIAAQMRVQSIPAVFAFVNGQPVDGFMGALPPSQVEEFVNKIASMGAGGAGGGLDEAVAAAEEMLAEGAIADAAQTFAAIAQEDPNRADAYAGLVKCHLAMKDLDQAQGLLDTAPDPIFNAPELVALRAQIDLQRAAEDAGDTADLRAKLEANPNDHETRFELATALLAAEKAEEAVRELLELFRRDREWNEDAARQQLFKIFDSLGPQDPIAQAGRRKLSSMIFA